MDGWGVVFIMELSNILSMKGPVETVFGVSQSWQDSIGAESVLALHTPTGHREARKRSQAMLHSSISPSCFHCCLYLWLNYSRSDMKSAGVALSCQNKAVPMGRFFIS